VLTTCNAKNPAAFNPDKFQPVEIKAEEVIYTYDVKWERSELTWPHRWDVYLKGNPDDEIHYFSIVNSLMIVLFLTGVVAMIMLRTLHKDISSYNEMQTLEEAQEESGWKLVHGDVFRPPAVSPMLLSVLAGEFNSSSRLGVPVLHLTLFQNSFCAGSGVQILAMTLCTMVCALFGLTSPSNRGGLLTTLLMLFVFMGSFAGYASARVYKLFNGKEWKRNTFLTATFYPGVMGIIYLSINGFVAANGSSTAAPVTTLLALMLLWFGISTPLVFVGSYFGFKKDTITVPVRTNQIARHIPDQVWYTHPAFSIALGGVLPFGAVCIELFFIMSAMWLHQVPFIYLRALSCPIVCLFLATTTLTGHTVTRAFFQPFFCSFTSCSASCSWC